MARLLRCFFFFFKQKTAYEMRISDWSSDVCSSDLLRLDTEAKANVRFGATCLITPRAAYRQQRADYGDINSATENLQKFATIGADFTCERPGLFPEASYEHDTTRHEIGRANVGTRDTHA